MSLGVIIDLGGYFYISNCPLQEKDHFNLWYRNKIISIYPSYKAGVKSIKLLQV